MPVYFRMFGKKPAQKKKVGLFFPKYPYTKFKVNLPDNQIKGIYLYEANENNSK